LIRSIIAGDEDEAARLLGELGECRRHPELLERLELGRDHAERRAQALALEEDIHAEARDARDGVREVELALRLEVLLLLRGEDAVEQALVVLGSQLPEVLEALEASVHPDGCL
jgi:hypothetical protein